ncbi:MAG: hypothetical protein JNK02_16085 [Planctomycetes bacterium]|nr:hypothetical protein [Planctomycetota bacterium]
MPERSPTHPPGVARTSAHAASLLLALLAAACGPQSDAGLPRATREGLVFEHAADPRPYFHDFGDRLLGETIAHTWRLTNREGRAIVVQDLLPDCGCTQPRAAVVLPDGARIEGPFETRGMGLGVPPGATLEVRIGLDTTRVERPNQHKLAQVRLRCDSDVTPYITFELHVLVKRTFRAVPAEAVLADVPQSAGKSVRLDVTTELAGERARIRGIERVEGPFHAELSETAVGSESVWILVVRAEPGSHLGPHTGKVVLGTTRGDGAGPGQDFEVAVRAVVVEDCVLEPRVLSIRREPGAVARATLVALVPGARVLVRRARLEGGAAEALRVDCQAEEPDEHGRSGRWNVRIEAVGELPREAFSGRLILELDEPHLPQVDAPFAG